MMWWWWSLLWWWLLLWLLLLLLHRTKPKYGDVVKVERGSVSDLVDGIVVQQQQQAGVLS